MYSQALPTALVATRAGVSHSLCVRRALVGIPAERPMVRGCPAPSRQIRNLLGMPSAWAVYCQWPRLRRFAEKYRRLRCRGVRLPQQTALDKKNRQVQDSLTVKRFVKKTYITQRGEL